MSSNQESRQKRRRWLWGAKMPVDHAGILWPSACTAPRLLHNSRSGTPAADQPRGCGMTVPPGVWDRHRLGCQGTISVAASIVTAIAFGIVVDDTIHLMSKYLRARAEGKSPSEAILPTFKLVGKPLLTTTLIFALGFLVFGASGLIANQTLGLLVGMTVVIALVADFLLFPPLLLAIDRRIGSHGRKG